MSESISPLEARAYAKSWVQQHIDLGCYDMLTLTLPGTAGDGNWIQTIGPMEPRTEHDPLPWRKVQVKQLRGVYCSYTFPLEALYDELMTEQSMGLVQPTLF